MLPTTAQLKREVDEQIARTAYEPAANLDVFTDFADSTCRAVHRCALPYSLLSGINSLTVTEAVDRMESVKTRLHVIHGAIAMEEIRVNHLHRLLG